MLEVCITSLYFERRYACSASGPLIRAMTDNMITAQNLAFPNTKMYLYSGHETNIASLLHAFGVYKPHIPEYSSAIILELHEIKGEHYVKVSIVYRYLITKNTEHLFSYWDNDKYDGLQKWILDVDV